MNTAIERNSQEIQAPRQVISHAGTGEFLQLIPVLERAREAHSARCGIFAFTAAVPGEGVTYVTEALARELAGMPGEKVLIVTAAALSSMVPADIERNTRAIREISPNVWTGSAYPLPGRQPVAVLTPELLAAIRHRFTYALVDCRSLRRSPEAIRFTPQVDGVFLIVAAGHTRRDQVARAQKVLQFSGENLAG